MNDVPVKAGDNENGGKPGGNAQPQQTPKKTAQYLARIEILKAISPNPNPEQPQQKAPQKNQTTYQKLKSIISSPATTNWLLVIIGFGAGIIAYRQNTLIRTSNETAVAALGQVDKSNDIAIANTGYTKQSADAATKAIKMAEEGEQTAKRTADSIKDTATANSQTAAETAKIANATYWVAKQNATTAEATKEIAATAERALRVSNEASVYAGRAASAAEEAVKMNQKSVALAARTTIHDLRAYLSVIGADLRFVADNNQRRRMVATVTIENTGKTPAHDVRFNWDVRCTPRVNGQIVDGGPFGTPIDATIVPRSFGPRSRFSYQKAWMLGSDDPQALNTSQMDMWIWGTVIFKDEFTEDEHFTEFNFTQGRQIQGTNQWQMVVTPYGNAMDRPLDRQVRDAADPASNAKAFTAPDPLEPPLRGPFSREQLRQLNDGLIRPRSLLQPER